MVQEWLWTAMCVVALLGCFGRAATAQYFIDTDNETINGSKVEYNGYPMSVSVVNGVTRYVVYGDIDFLYGSVVVTGSRPVSLVATNNVSIATGVYINVSGSINYAFAGGGREALAALQSTVELQLTRPAELAAQSG